MAGKLYGVTSFLHLEGHGYHRSSYLGLLPLECKADDSPPSGVRVLQLLHLVPGWFTTSIWCKADGLPSAGVDSVHV